MTDLKPCPFCGGEPVFQRRRVYYPRFRAFCDQGAEHAVFMGGETEEQAIAAWNRRAAQPEGYVLVPLEADATWQAVSTSAFVGIAADETERLQALCDRLSARVKELEALMPKDETAWRLHFKPGQPPYWEIIPPMSQHSDGRPDDAAQIGRDG